MSSIQLKPQGWSSSTDYNLILYISFTYMKLAMWVTCHHRPFVIVKNDKLVGIFTDLNNKVGVLSQFTVSRDVKEIFLMSQVKVSEILKVCDVILLGISS